MPATSLKDLTSPMQKISKALEETNETTKSILSVVSGIAGTLSRLELITTQLDTISTQLSAILGNVKKSSNKTRDKGLIKKNKDSADNKKESLKEGAELLGILGGSIKTFSQGMLIFALVPKKTSKRLNESIKDILEAISSVENPDKAVKNAALLGDIGEAIFVFSASIALSAPFLIIGIVVLPLAVFEINFFLNQLSDEAKTEQTNIALTNITMLGKVGLSMFAFFALMVLSAPLMVASALIVPVAVFVVNTFIDMIAGNSKNNKDLKEGLSNSLMLGQVGLNFVAFMLLMLMAGVISVPLMITLPFIFLTTWVTSKILKLFGGKNSVDIMKGAAVMLLAGASLVVLGVSLLVFSVALTPFVKKPITILIMAGVLAALGLVFAGAGLLAGPIALGALAMLAVAVSTIVLSLGLKLLYLSIKDYTEDNIKMTKDLILGLGTGFAGVGLMAIAVIPGAIAMLLVAVSLIFVSVGLKIFKNVGWNAEKDTAALMGAFGAIRAAFLGTDGKDEGGLKGAFKKFGGMITGAFDAVRLVEAAAGFTAAGVALIVVASGLKAMKKLEWTDNDTMQLINSLTAMSNAFEAVGKSGNVQKTKERSGLVGAIFGDIVADKNAVKEGIDSVLGAGKALKSISVGLTEFTNWYAANKDKLDISKPDSEFYVALKSTIGAIGTAFAAVGGTTNDQIEKHFGIFKWNKNAVKEGIDSVKDAGDALTGIAKGLVEFTNWYASNRKLIDVDPDHPEKKSLLLEALKSTIGTVGKAFAAIGSDTEPKEAVFGLIKWDKNLTSAGIKAVKKAGDALTGIAKGLTEFTNWYASNRNLIDIDPEHPEKKSVLLEALKSTIGTVGKAFAAIGSDTEPKEAFFGLIKWDKNLTSAGIKAVKDVEGALTNITNGLIVYTNFYKSNENLLETKGVDADGIPTSGLLHILYITLTSIGKAFSAIGGAEVEEKFGLFSWDSNAVKLGIESVNNVQTAIQNVVNGMMVFVKSGITAPQVKLLTKLLFGMGSGFSALAEINLRAQGRKFESFANHFNKGFDIIYKNTQAEMRMKTVNSVLFNLERQTRLNTFDKAAAGIKKISEAVNSIDIEKGYAFSDLFVAASNLKDNKQFYRDLMEAVEKIKEILERQSATGEGGSTADGNKTVTATVNRNTQSAPQPPQRPARSRQQQTQQMPQKVESITITATNVVVNEN